MIVRLSLIEQLPEGQRSEQHLEESLRSPQFRQSLGEKHNPYSFTPFIHARTIQAVSMKKNPKYY